MPKNTSSSTENKGDSQSFRPPLEKMELIGDDLIIHNGETFKFVRNEKDENLTDNRGYLAIVSLSTNVIRFLEIPGFPHGKYAQPDKSQ